MKFNFFTRIYLYIHFFQCHWVMSMELILTKKNVAQKIHGCHKSHGTKCVLVQKWDAKLKPDQIHTVSDYHVAHKVPP